MQANLEATLATLVAIPSVSEDSAACHEIVTFIHNQLKAYDLFIESDFSVPNPWLLATTKDTKEPDILLHAHLDVVPAAEHMFQMEKRGDNLYGRGVYDMKNAVACYLEFLREHANELHTMNIGFLFITDEEINSNCMPIILSKGLRPKVAFIPDGGDNWTLEKRAKGFYGIEITATGTSAHGSRPWEGKSALHTLLDAVQHLRDRYPSQEKHAPTFMVNSIKSGHAFNQIPDYASALLDFRCFSKKELDECHALVADIVKKYDLGMTILHSGDSIEFNENDPHVQTFLEVFKDERKNDVIPYGDSYGGTDARFFARHGISSIIIEPHGGGRHGDEWLKANDLSRYYRLLERWIIRGI